MTVLLNVSSTKELNLLGAAPRVFWSGADAVKESIGQNRFKTIEFNISPKVVLILKFNGTNLKEFRLFIWSEIKPCS